MIPRLTLEKIREDIARTLRETVQTLYGIEVERIVLERPTRVSLGDFATPTACAPARKLRRAPRTIAAEIAAATVLPEGVREVRVEAGGYVNFFVHRGDIAAGLLGPPGPPPRPGGQGTRGHPQHQPNK